MMEEFTRLLAAFLLPLYNFFQPDERVYWLYFVTAYAIAMLAYLKAGRDWSFAALKTCLAGFFAKRIWTHHSAIADYKMVFVNNFTYFLLFPYIVIGSTTIAALTAGGLEAVTGSAGLGLAPSTTGRVALTIVWLLAWDFSFFAAHYLQHKVPLLWEFHKVHHSAEVMTPFTVFRMHPIDDLLASTMVGLLIGLVQGVFNFIYADPLTFYMVNGLNVAWFVFLFAGYHLRHSHIWIMYPKPVRDMISSPALHMIHHSDNPKHFDKNFARIFIFWDQLAGTLYMPKEREEIAFGLGGGEHRDYVGLWRIYALPFKKAARLFRPKEPAKT